MPRLHHCPPRMYIELCSLNGRRQAQPSRPPRKGERSRNIAVFSEYPDSQKLGRVQEAGVRRNHTAMKRHAKMSCEHPAPRSVELGKSLLSENR